MSSPDNDLKSAFDNLLTEVARSVSPSAAPAVWDAITKLEEQVYPENFVEAEDFDEAFEEAQAEAEAYAEFGSSYVFGGGRVEDVAQAWRMHTTPEVDVEAGPYVACEHGLSADLCAGPGHYPMDGPF